MPQRQQGHRQQGRGDLLPGGQQHVHLPGIRAVGHLPAQGLQPIGLPADGGNHHNDLMAGVQAVRNATRHPLDALRIADAGAAEFLDDQRHADALGRQSAPPSQPEPRARR